MAYSKEAAEDLAVQAVQFLASRPELCTRFLAGAGLAPDQLAGLAKSPEIHLHIIDFISENDDMIIELAAALGIRPEEVMQARTALAGPGSYGWDAD